MPLAQANPCLRSRHGRPVSNLSPPKDDPHRYAYLAGAAILAVISLQLVFLLVGCTWDFSGDEAEYWAWSRRLDWSYFAKGPLIAWLIRGSTTLFGQLSLDLTGSLMFAGRLPSVILGGITAWGLFLLASVTLQSPRAALWATLLLPAVPLFAIGGVLMTIDTPLVCAWTWSAYFCFRALTRGDEKSWIFAGLIGALGVLAKYSMLALPASVGLFLLLSSVHRRMLLRPGFWLMTVLTIGLGLAPIIVWNLQNHWVAAGQMADRLGLSHRASWSNVWVVLTFLGCEFAVLSGVWWIAGFTALVQSIQTVLNPTDRSGPADHSAVGLPVDSLEPSPREGLLFLLCLWAVIWFACLGASVLGETEANWMAPGYVSLLALIGWRANQILAGGGNRPKVYIASWLFCIAAVIVIHHTDWFYPAIARWVPEPNRAWAVPLRVGDPTARMRGHQPLAAAVEKQLEGLRQSETLEPFVLTPTYALASTLSFYLPGQPDTFCLSWNDGMKQKPVNQHDLWHPNPRNDLAAFKGRSAVVVEDCNMPPSYAWSLIDNDVFRSVRKVERITVEQGGIIVGAWDVSILEDYKGIANYGKKKAHKQKKATRSP